MMLHKIFRTIHHSVDVITRLGRSSGRDCRPGLEAAPSPRLLGVPEIQAVPRHAIIILRRLRTPR